MKRHKLIALILFSIVIIHKSQAQDRSKSYLFSNEINELSGNENRCTHYSFIGDIENAIKGFSDDYDCKWHNYQISAADSLDFINCYPVDARKYIIEQAKNKKIVLINEGHNMPMHRAFTLSLLQSLYDEGYRYFGAEAFTNFSTGVKIGKNENSNYPIDKTGYYLKDPVFGDLIRQALKIGFKLFAYEDTLKNSEVKKNGIVDMDLSRRNYYMALNIKSILDKDPSAKILIHAGYGHIIEEKGAMGGELKKLTGLDPLSISQTTMSEAENRECENPYFKMVDVTSPTVYIRKMNDSVFLDNFMRNRTDIKEKNHLDIEVFQPRTKYVNGRANWLYMNGRRNAIEIDAKYLTLGYPVLVFAYYLGENINEAVPIDVIEIKSKEDIKPLVLPKGNFNIVIQNQERKTTNYQIKN